MLIIKGTEHTEEFTPKSLKKQIELSFCGGLLVESELFEDDGYYFLTDKARERLADQILSLIIERLEGIENPPKQ